MAEIIKMPKLSDTMEEGRIAKWLIKEGDPLKEGEIFLQIETDKATMDYASPHADGFLLKILVPEGESVKLAVPLGVVGKRGEKFELPTVVASLLVASPPNQKQGGVLGETAQLVPLEKKAERIRVSPLARKMAEEKGVELSSITGSGPMGRIIAKDIAATSKAHVGSTVDTKIPHSMMRKTIAKRLLSAKNEAPHFYLTLTINMDRALDFRESMKEEGVKLSVNDLLMLACAKALQKHPEINAGWSEEAIIRHGAIDIAMAVALESGLITPVLKNVDKLGLKEISALAKDLGQRAKLGTLKPEDYTGAYFTVSNLGMTRVEEFTAIINPPGACILAVGTILKVPVFNSKNELVPQQQMKVTLSCDHRVVDGMVGAKFLETLAELLENPMKMLL